MVDAPSEVTTRTGAPYPDHDQKPGWFDNYLLQLALHLEKMGVPKYATASARDIAIPSPADGDMCWLNDNDVLQVYDGGWTQVYPSTQPLITSGTAAPSGGSDGDIYLRYV